MINFARHTSAGVGRLGPCLWVGFMLAASAFADDIGDTPEAATRLQYDTAAYAMLETREDVDVFRLDLQGQADVEVLSTGDTDTVGRLLAADDTVVAEDDDSGRGFNFRLRETLEGGVYYVEVGSSFESGDYGVLARIRKTGDDHGDTARASSALPLNLRLAGSISPAEDVDVWRIDVPVETTLHAYTDGPADTSGRLSDATGNRIASAVTGGSGGNFRIDTAVEAGIYYLEVSADDVGAYGVRAEVADDGSCPATPPDGGGGGTPDPEPEPTPAAPTVDVPDVNTVVIRHRWSVQEGDDYAFDYEVRYKGTEGWPVESCARYEDVGSSGRFRYTLRLRTDLESGRIVEARYRYRNSGSCETGSPGPWSDIGEGEVPAEDSRAGTGGRSAVGDSATSYADFLSDPGA